MNAQNISMLVFLDMSSAFDCVDHSLLLDKLRFRFGLSGTVERCFVSYLTNRTQQVVYDGSMSEVESVLSGVLQGSVLGPLMFLLYTADVIDIVKKYRFKCHVYADDIQIIASSSVADFRNLMNNFTRCLSEVGEWMLSNGLKLNQKKTQLLPIGTKQQLFKLGFDSIIIDGQNIQFCNSVSNLGVVFDSHLSMRAYSDAVPTVLPPTSSITNGYEILG